MIKDWEWEDSWIAFFMALAVTLASLIVTALVHDHSVKYYFIDSKSGESITCVMGHADWGGSDRTSFCSSDIDKVLVVLDAANKSLKGVKK